MFKLVCFEVLIETWLSPNYGITPADFSIYRQDRTLDSSKQRGGEKPWINAEVQAKLRARATAYNSDDPASYKKARYDLQRSIRLAKRSYRDRVESIYLGFDPSRMWSGLRTITDYKEGVSCERVSSSCYMSGLEKGLVTVSVIIRGLMRTTQQPIFMQSSSPEGGT
ncbi:hypothetical protein MHYP_G00089120 [Metynnis hypsauchen]